MGRLNCGGRSGSPAKPEIIYCADGNAKFAEIAVSHGFTYGAQLPRKIYFKPEFVDQDWKKPDFAKYILALAAYRPRLATVLDWEYEEQLPEVLKWAEGASVYVSEGIIIIPKVIGGISRLPRRINGRDVILGYSVPTQYGGTPVPTWEFRGWPVHLLGGSPQQQRRLSFYMDVVSVDGNMHHKMATGRSRSGIVAVWQQHSRRYEKGHWVSLDLYRKREFGLPPVEHDAPYEAFKISCENIMAMWGRL